VPVLFGLALIGFAVIGFAVVRVRVLYRRMEEGEKRRTEITVWAGIIVGVAAGVILFPMSELGAFKAIFDDSSQSGSDSEEDDETIATVAVDAELPKLFTGLSVTWGTPLLTARASNRGLGTGKVGHCEAEFLTVLVRWNPIGGGVRGRRADLYFHAGFGLYKVQLWKLVEQEMDSAAFISHLEGLFGRATEEQKPDGPVWRWERESVNLFSNNGIATVESKELATRFAAERRSRCPRR